MWYLKKHWLKYRRLFIISVVCVACEACCDLLQPRVMSVLIDDGAMKGDLDVVLRTGALMLVILLCGATFAIVRNATSSKASQGFGADLREELFVKIQSLSLDDMDSFEGGSLVTRETSDVTQLQTFANGLMRIFVKAPVMCVGGIVMSATLDLKAIPIIVPVISLVVIVIFISMKLAYPRFARVQTSLDRLNTTIREYLAGIRLARAFRRFEAEEARFNSANDPLTEDTVSATRILAVFSPFLALFVNLGITAIIFFGARWVNAGELQVGKVMAFVTYMLQILASLNMISNLMNMFVRVKASHERIAEVLSVPDAPPADSGGAERVPGSAHIEFDRVCFAYKGSTGQAALTDISFSLRRGETVGIIGPTGSGKSTIASLLMRFYDVTSGEIRLGGVPVRQIPENELHEQVSIVPQTPMLFSGTIAENLRWGKDDATEDELSRAIRAAQAEDFIGSSARGYDTVIGQSGVNLSGGQKQRISIARALVRGPDIIVLDDCTSALDVLTEARVRHALREYDMTCVLITQRVSTAKSCDRVLVLSSGHQAGFGTHEELMESCDEYRDIFESQIGKAAI